MSKLITHYNKLQRLMFEPVDPGSLALFRVFFGLILAFYAHKEAAAWLVHYKFEQPTFLFTFPLFEYLHLKVLPEDMLLTITKLIGLSACWIALGLYFRFALIVFFCTFGYMFLLEKAYFNNHAYLILLLAFLLMFMGSHRSFSLDALRDPKISRRQIPFWNIFLLRAQLCIVYFFAAVPKLYPDYLGGRQMSVWLITQDKLPLLKNLIPLDLAVIFFTYASLSFDLLIGLLLCYKPTRFIAMVIAISFHLLNSLLFPIGIFPFLMIAALVLFIDPDQFKAFGQRIRSCLPWKESAPLNKEDQAPGHVNTQKAKLTLCSLSLYLVIQILIPLRHFLIPGNVNWTKEGIRFSWMLMANVMHGTLNFVVIDPSTNENIAVNLQEDINFDQYIDLVYTPDMVLQYVHFLKKKLQAQGIENPAIYVDGRVSINGRPHLPFIDPTVDLANKEYRFMSAADWILPPPEDM